MRNKENNKTHLKTKGGENGNTMKNKNDFYITTTKEIKINNNILKTTRKDRRRRNFF